MFKRLFEIVLGFILYSIVQIWPFISQTTFAVMTVSVARITNASISLGGVMVTVSVQMDQMRKIAVVRMIFMFSIFSKVCLMYNWNRIDMVTLRTKRRKYVSKCFKIPFENDALLQVSNNILLHFENNIVNNDVVPRQFFLKPIYKLSLA